jgi:hypothetical protein
MRWAGHVAIIRSKRNTYKILIEKLKQRDRYKNFDLNRRKIINGPESKRIEECGLDQSGSIIGEIL